MFRIRKTIELGQTSVLSVEGEIREENLAVWRAELDTLLQTNEGNVILNFHSVSFMDASAVPKLMELGAKRVYVLNCSNFVKNMLQAAGLASMIID
jgi:anti-anti-sigma factor